jgi:hypothetical protein
MKTSFRFEFIGEQGGNEVYTTEMKIPESVVAGSDKGLFEVHYNKNSRKIVEIYLVA